MACKGNGEASCAQTAAASGSARGSGTTISANLNHSEILKKLQSAKSLHKRPTLNTGQSQCANHRKSNKCEVQKNTTVVLAFVRLVPRAKWRMTALSFMMRSRNS